MSTVKAKRLVNENLGTFSLVDDDIYEQYKHRSISHNAQGYISIDNQLLSHLVLGKPLKGYVVDHIDHDKNNNTRSNLRFLTRSENSQNQVPRGASKYKNVHWHSTKNKYIVVISKEYKRNNMGHFANEDDAGYHANIVMKQFYGESANLNKNDDGTELSKPPTYDAVREAQLRLQLRSLPKNICRSGKQFEARIVVDKKIFRGLSPTVEGAIELLESIKKQVDIYRESRVVVEKPLVVIKETTPTYLVCLTTNLQHEYRISPVSYDLIKNHSWYNALGYIQTIGTVGGKMRTMHRFLLSHDDGGELPVDHLNGIKADNRLENLRIATPAQNAQNRKSSGLSGFLGVKATKWKTFEAHIGYKQKLQFLGSYPTIELAAWVYNQMAINFYGPQSAQNDVPDLSHEYEMVETNNRRGNQCWRAQALVLKQTEMMQGKRKREE